MADTVLEQIVGTLGSMSPSYFPLGTQAKTVRVVGHTPKPDHFIYEIVLDFPQGSERVNAKIYRSKSSAGAKEHAEKEVRNLALAFAAAEKRNLSGVPRPIGKFEALGAVVSTKVNGLPLQSIIMKSALLPDSANDVLLEVAARQAGEWLQQFHKATAGTSSLMDGEALLAEMGGLCARAEKEGLPAESIDGILSSARTAIAKLKKPMRTSAVLREFVPLNVLVATDGIGVCEFASLDPQGHSLYDPAIFLAAVEALEKYPFCNRTLTTVVQDAFVDGYGVTAQERPVLDTLKMKVLLQMFAQGRTGKESAERKKVMWANVMKRFLQQAAERSSAKAA